MSCLNFEYTKAVTYTVENVGGNIGQDPVTKVTHLRLNQLPAFSVYIVSKDNYVSDGDNSNP